MKRYPVVSLPADAIVDTNGCGDAFVGGGFDKSVLYFVY